MDWNTSFTNMFGDATELMYGTNFLSATEAMQRAFIGALAVTPVAAIAPVTKAAKLAAAAPDSTHENGYSNPFSSTQVLDTLLPERQAGSADQAPKAAKVPDNFHRIAITLGGALHHYWLYVPPGASAETPMPLVMMLHGCSQEAKEFASATQMNLAAAPANALVLYPEQARGANPGGCWNWFESENQRRDRGELDLVVAMLRDVMAHHPVDEQRVYAAGISAGGAMAALLAREYPELFAAVGVHSGLRAGAADNMMAALSAMNNGAKLGTSDQPPTHLSGKPQPALIVFHGDNDTTVDAKNGEQLVEAALQTALGDKNAALHETQQGQSDAGQRFTRNLYRASDSGEVLVEHWILHNTGHAWSGGNPKVSQTDARGANATQEMLRFFLEHPQKH